ncbi:MAG TPA: diguanylate cyclase [Geobacteraceae bacterium]|nr:diguanylate cyclase [Geobacteraceae bacterium]
MRILVAEDDQVTRFILCARLAEWGYDVIAAGDGNEAWRELQAEDAPRLVILDWKMPGVDGVELCRRVRRKGGELYTYIILLTAQQDEGDLVTGMEAGADDYITKPFKTGELRVRLRAGRRIIELQNNLIEAREALRDKATHDPLTGLWNHGEILLILDREISRTERDGSCVSVIMADLDHFKKVNDGYGHMAGDEVLRLTAHRMHSLVRDYDSIGRYGGEEFLLVLPGCDASSASDLAERLRLSICAAGMDTAEGMIPITISLGVATIGKWSMSDPEDLVRAADLALYRAKANGRNRVEIASEDEFKGDEMGGGA